MWQIARDSGTLDLNSSYAYLMMCRDFARTSRLAWVDGRPAGFVIAYRRPARPDCLFVWQVAVDAAHRGHGIAARLLDDLVESELRDPSEPVLTVETTITEDNLASRTLFRRFAERWDAPLYTSDLFVAADFPDDHDGEPLIEIGPLTAPRTDPA